MFKKILVALDHSQADSSLLPRVKELARLTGGEILLLHVSTGWAAQWQDNLNEALARAGRKVEDLQTGLRSAEWKLRIALQLRKDHGIAIRWLAERLCLGKPNSARSLLWRTRNAN